jgi:hypothetical protein
MKPVILNCTYAHQIWKFPVNHTVKTNYYSLNLGGKHTKQVLFTTENVHKELIILGIDYKIGHGF